MDEDLSPCRGRAGATARVWDVYYAGLLFPLLPGSPLEMDGHAPSTVAPPSAWRTPASQIAFCTRYPATDGEPTGPPHHQPNRFVQHDYRPRRPSGPHQGRLRHQLQARPSARARPHGHMRSPPPHLWPRPHRPPAAPPHRGARRGGRHYVRCRGDDKWLADLEQSMAC